MDIHALNRRRAEAAELVRALGYANQPTKYEDRVAADARYRLATDAHRRAESEYQAALNSLSTEELAALAN